MNDESASVITGRPAPGHQMIFAKILLISKTHLSNSLHKSIAAADKFLYDICQQDQSTIGSPNIENLKTLRFYTQAMQLQFTKAIDDRFAKFQSLSTYELQTTVDLSLVGIEDTDDVVSTELLSEALTRSFSEQVSITNQRVCALFGFNQSEQSKTPLTEKHMAEFLLYAFQNVEVSPKVRLIVFRYYEQALLETLSAMLDEVNQPLVDAGILLSLGSLSSQQKINKFRDEQRARSDSSNGLQPNSTSQSRLPMFQTTANLQVGAAENALFEEICNYLHTLRPHAEQANINIENQPGNNAANHYGDATQHVLSTNEMLSVLSILQTSIPDSIAAAMKNPDASIAKMLKSEMLGSAPKRELGSEPYEITRDDEDAVDLVGMLFDVLMSERDFRDEAKTLISRLVIPYTKAAILDRRLFLTKAHPARKLLNSLTEAVEGNHGDGPQERELLNRAENTVDQLLSGFNEDIAIFELLEHELRTYLDQHRRRIDLAEKRAKEAQRGQDRLENARALAARELEMRTRQAELPAVMQDFFSRYWTHHLSMVALREGEDSQSWKLAIKLADDIISILINEPAEQRYASIMHVAPSIESVLSSSGVLSDSSIALVQRIAESAKHFNAAQRVSIPSHEHESGLSESSLHLVFNKDSLDYNQDDADFFKALAIGTWLQLEGSNGSYSPIKLAWISPISSRLMFVNRRGVRVLVVSVEELAQMKKQGKLIIHAQDNVFEQTMDRVLDRLKSDFG